ncbi:MAG: NAD(P)/FAD-dependent oxidoreductase [Desulfobaccales bacterium]
MPAWDYDLIIIGGGPAGLTAGIYAGRARLKTLLLEKLIHGGQMMTTDLIENYPGFPEGVTGLDPSEHMRKRAERFGLEFRRQEVLELNSAVTEDGQSKDLLPMDGWGCIFTGELMAAEDRGIFADRDVRCKPWRQISTAVGDGSVAAIATENYLEELKRG